MKTDIFGVKGFNTDLKCRNHQFEIDKTYIIDDKPKLCQKGFHYSKNIIDVVKYYENNSRNRFCIVKILGDIDEGIDKCCTNKIQIVSEIPLDKFKIKSTVTVNDLIELNNKGYIIGGSLALRIQGFKFDREFTDIDLISKDKIDEKKIKSDFDGYSSLNVYSGIDSVYAFRGLFGEKYDILKPNEFYPIKRMYQNREVLVQDENYIWNIKLKYALAGSLKHINDIRNNNISFSKICIQEDNNLPI